MTVIPHATTALASGVSNTLLSGMPCLIRRVVVTSTGTASTTFYDNTAASGTVLFVTPPNVAVGQIFDIEMPASKGIYAVGVSGSPALTVSTGVAAPK
jgi:hypothetical protein